ncbi:DUF4167 domain-containing protein [Sphingomonas sp.]|uniref:DUF4167 domain-containing protein n=1 Tax=Sphingomonas sp. TaxID=28214 RepID=UPI00333F9181
MINNRQAGRRRGRGGQQQRSSGGNPGRQDSGNRIDNRARGNAAQLLEKYKTLARDAQMQGDRVNVEYYLQFADHYFRVLAETRARFEENGGAVSTRRIQGATLDEDEPDYEDEGERGEQPQPEQTRGDQNRGPQREGQNRDYQRDNQPRDGQNRDGQQRGQQNGYRQDGRQDGRPDGNRGYAQNGNQNGNAQRDQNGASDGRADQQRGNGQDYDNRGRTVANGNVAEGGSERQAEAPREEQNERPPRRERYERTERVARPAEPVEQEVPVAVAADAPEVAEPPRRGRGRPRREVAPVETDAPGLENVGFMAERLPPSLNVSAVAESAGDTDGEDVAEKPRRRRGRPPASAATTAE